MAHEVKNPINAIVVHLELLREKMREIDPDTRRHMDIIGREIHRLDRVVQMLVDFNRPVELRLADFDLRTSDRRRRPAGISGGCAPGREGRNPAGQQSRFRCAPTPT